MTSPRSLFSFSQKPREPGVRVSGRRSAGFTLIEIMMVMVILVAVLTIGAPRLFNTTAAMRSQLRDFAIMTREIRNVARLTTSTMRIVINMSEEKGHSYWVESAPGNVTLLSQDQQKELEKLTTIQREDEKPKNEFQADSRVLKKPKRLPKGMFFESVEFTGRDEAVTSGPAYIHFFPQGLAEEVAIHFTDRKTLNWTITINPLTGRAEIYERKVTLKELSKP